MLYTVSTTTTPAYVSALGSGGGDGKQCKGANKDSILIYSNDLLARDYGATNITAMYVHSQ